MYKIYAKGEVIEKNITDFIKATEEARTLARAEKIYVVITDERDAIVMAFHGRYMYWSAETRAIARDPPENFWENYKNLSKSAWQIFIFML